MTRTTLVLAAFFAAPLAAQPSADDPVENVQDLTLQWTRLEQQRDLLQSAWRADRPVLEQQLALLEREARELEAFLAESRAEQDEVAERRLELLEEQTRLERAQAALEQALRSGTIRLRSLRPQLPPPLIEGWDEDLPRLDDPVLTASEKLRLMLDLLGQLDDFEQKVTLNETVMTLGDGREYFVQQVYLGLSHGWYVTADRQFAAAGRATPTGWQWTPTEAADQIAQIVGILQRRQNPELVSIPLELSARPPGAGN